MYDVLEVLLHGVINPNLAIIWRRRDLLGLTFQVTYSLVEVSTLVTDTDRLKPK